MSASASTDRSRLDASPMLPSGAPSKIKATRASTFAGKSAIGCTPAAGAAYDRHVTSGVLTDGGTTDISVNFEPSASDAGGSASPASDGSRVPEEVRRRL